MAQLSSSLNNKGLREHGSPIEAFRCHRDYLISQGYQRVDSRAFQPPPGPDGEPQPIRVLTKRSRFGARMRPGKGQRHMPSVRTGGVVVLQ